MVCESDRKVTQSVNGSVPFLANSKVHFNNGSDLFVQMSVFVKFIGFPKTGYLDITAVYHDTIQI